MPSITRSVVPSLLLAVLVSLLAAGCRNGKPGHETSHRSSAEGALTTFIEAQESGDKDRVLDLIVAEHRAAFERLLAELDRHDLIATGLQFRQEGYRLEDLTERMAIFWSESSAMYLVMMRESDTWRVDPQRTDEMNADAAAIREAVEH